MSRVILIALDSVGIDPLGHGRPESVYARSRFLFPREGSGDLIPVTDAPVPGALVETDVAGGAEAGALECAITYTSIFSGRSAIERHGLMRAIGLRESLLREMVAEENLFRRFAKPCLVNAVFPFHLPFLGSSYTQDLVPERDGRRLEESLTFHERPVCLRGPDKHGFAELFTLAEINQNIFVHAAREAGLSLRTWGDVRRRRALTGTMTNELESAFNWEAIGEQGLPELSPDEAASALVRLASGHDFTFYKYQMADLISHTGRVDQARATFAVIESFLEAVLRAIDPDETVVIVTSDHGHLEQLDATRGHPKSKVPTWYFGEAPLDHADRMRRPEDVFHVVAEHAIFTPSSA